MTSQPKNSPATEMSVGSFFDQASEKYDDSIRKAIPPYQEMFEALLGYCHWEKATVPARILELGCGTGNFSILLRSYFPEAQLTLVDLSADMLKLAEGKLKGMSALGDDAGSIELVQSGFMDLEFPPAQFDLIISSMALHHLLDSEKPELYTRLFQWLKPGGLFRCADEVLSVPYSIHEQQLMQWEQWARSSGATDEDIAFWSAHAEQYDHYASLTNHFKWLHASGFIQVDCYWRKLMWSVFGAQKPV